MKADTNTEKAVMEVMNQFLKGFSNRDLDSMLILFAPDPDIVFIGTGADEKCIGKIELKSELKRAFAQSEESSIEYDWYSVSASGSMAWVAADATVRAKVREEKIEFPIRITAVFEQRGDRWLFVQSHASMPAAGQKDGQSWPTDKTK